jgi:hypothetical protein
MKYEAPTHYEPAETVKLDDVREGARLEVHMRTGKYAGREFYFTVKHIYSDHFSDGTFHLTKRDLVKGNAELRDRDYKPASYPMVAGEGAPQYTFDLPSNTQLALF